MTFIFIAILVGAAVSVMRNWIAVGFASAALFGITTIYEWRTGAGLTTALSMGVVVCVVLQASFLTAAYVSMKYLQPDAQDIALTQQAAPMPSQPVSLLNRNDRRIGLAGGPPPGKERRGAET